MNLSKSFKEEKRETCSGNRDPGKKHKWMVVLLDLMALGIKDVVADSVEVLLAIIDWICMLGVCFQVVHFDPDINVCGGGRSTQSEHEGGGGGALTSNSAGHVMSWFQSVKRQPVRRSSGSHSLPACLSNPPNSTRRICSAFRLQHGGCN